MRSPGREVWIDGVGQFGIPPMAKSTHIKLLLVRAGASVWDDAGRLSGSADLPLSEAGRQAVASFAAGIEPGSVCQVWSGPEEAAEGTAKAVGEAADARVKVVPGLHELGVGLWEGLDEATAEDRGGRAYRQWREDPTAVVPPGGEALSEAAERVSDEVRALLAKCRGDETCGVCLVLRPMVFGIVRCWLTGEGYGALWSWVGGEEMGAWLLVDRESVRGGTRGGPGAVRCAG
ncbi:MAG: histidine phosphatase family protein [Phycisphaerales bacterium]|nr:histidine phosphatase family protein [Phycisphaerales bacterium]